MARLCGAMKFHRRCGDRVTLLNNNTTAVRNFVEFNHGLIMSAEPLKNDVLFEVCIDRKVNVWNGSLEIGVTTLDPEHVELPATATKLRNTAWIMSGSSIVKDGVTLINSYGPELDTLREADFLGVTRTSKGELMFYINGRCLGVAAKDLPPRLFAVIDLYGQCVQVSIMQGNNLRPIMEASFDQIDEDPNNDDTLTDLDEQGAVGGYPKHVYVPMSADGACALVVQDRLRFHPRCGILVKLSAMNKTAERTRPLDDYNNGVVMTHRPLYDNELFEIRIDKLVDKWSGSIEVGVTTHNPATIRFPSTMTNMESGTIMMSGCKVLFNGHGSCVEYGNFNLDELREGDTVAMMRKDSGELHYYINGVDQGVATDKVESQVWGVVDLYGMTVKVSIVDPCEDIDSNAISSPDLDTSRCRPPIDEDTLLFHTLRDSNVIVFDDGKTAHRPNAFEFFDNGIVMTNRTLRTNELFQVRLDLIVPKWAGSIEIGVTQYSFNELEYPFRITSATSGTWVIAGEDMIRNGAIVIPQYVRNLNRLMEGDMVGVMRKETGILHFYVNGVDQGPAAFNVPENVYGIIDLYGRVAQATITEIYVPPPIYSPDSDSTGSNATTYPEMCFHRAHGRNARLNRNRLTASRAAVYSEFNDAVLFSSRPLRECDMFELRIDKMVDCWIGSLEIGVTAINPEDLEAHGGVGAVAGTATDLVWDTYVLSGAAMMKDGECVRSGYPLDLDTLTVGSRVGMMWHADRSLHYYLDGMDMGKAWYVPHLNIYAVVDLYGQCAQVTILQNEERGFNYNGCPNTSIVGISRALSSPRPPYWSFSEYCGDNVTMLHEYTTARRRTADPTANLVFSSAHLAVDELFEIKIAECKHGYAGSFRMGVTDIDILNAHVNRRLPPAISYLPHFTAYVDGSYIKYSTVGTKKHEKCSFAPSFEWLRPGDRIGLKRTRDARVLLYYNSELLETAFTGIPEKVYVVMELFGRVTKISAVIRTITAENALIPTTTFATMPGVQVHNAETTETADEDLPVATVTEVVVNEPQVVTMPEPSAAEPSVEADEAAEPKEDEATTQGAEEEVTELVASQNEAAALPVSEVPDPRRWRRPLPYTFHYVHGGNVRLCSSDTVALRTSGFDDAIAIVSQPLRRGHNFRFRVDRISERWSGSASLGAVVSLPETLLPFNAIHLDPPAWVVSSETFHVNGVVYMQDQLWRELEECITEQSVLSIHFRFNGELIVEVNGKMLFNMGIVERSYSHVFPLIDLYGRIEQVSILLHPHVVSGGMSLDLPIILELEEALSDLENDDEEDDDEPPASPESARKPKKIRAYSHDNLMEEEAVPLLALPGTSSQPDPPPQRGARARNITLHRSFILADGTVKRVVNLTLKKSYSSHSFRNIPEDPVLAGSRLVLLRQLSLNVESRVWAVAAEQAAVHEHLNDTNIRHNDRYPEAGDVDNLDSEIIDALTLETGNLPDLSEEQSSSIDESTRRDDIWAGLLAVENMTYLHQLLSLPQEEGAEAEGEGEGEPGVRGEGCEHLHLVLKYWRALVQPYPELRRAAAWGLVRCHCANCHPDAPPALAGWVRIERASVGEVVGRRAFWHVARSSLGSAQAQTADAAGPARRPRCLLSMPTHDAPFDDIWLDEDGKPHDTVLVVEIGIDCSEAVNDRLVAFRIYLKAHVAPADDNPSSCDE